MFTPVFPTINSHQAAGPGPVAPFLALPSYLTLPAVLSDVSQHTSGPPQGARAC